MALKHLSSAFLVTLVLSEVLHGAGNLLLTRMGHFGVCTYAGIASWLRRSCTVQIGVRILSDVFSIEVCARSCFALGQIWFGLRVSLKGLVLRKIKICHSLRTMRALAKVYICLT